MVSKFISGFALFLFTWAAFADVGGGQNYINYGDVTPGVSGLNAPGNASMPQSNPAGLITLQINKTVGASAAYHFFSDGGPYSVPNGSTLHITRRCVTSEVAAGRQGQIFSIATNFNEGATTPTTGSYENGAVGQWGYLNVSQSYPFCESSPMTIAGRSGGNNVAFEAGITGVLHVMVHAFLSTP